MKQLVKNITYDVLAAEELSAAEQELVNAAKEATGGAYAPYSHFFVGAAVRLSDGTIVKGANQENGAYPSGLCAERTALFAAGANHPNTPVEAIAIAAYTNGEYLDTPITPCGACAQVMAETEARADKKLQILLYGKNVIYRLNGVDSILPFAFSLK